MMRKPKLIRITTVPISLEKLLQGQLRFMSSHFEVIAVSSEKDNLAKVGQLEGVEVFHVEMTRKITPIADLKSVFRLYRFLRRERPFMIHSHTPKAGIVGMLAAKLARVPHRLHTVAGLPLLEATGKKRKLLDFVEKFTYACATNVYPNSFGLKEIIIQNKYCDPNKLKVLANGSSNGIDTDHFSASHFSAAENLEMSKSLSIEPADFVFIFVGRLVKDKGINELIGAFRILADEFPQVKLLLVGDYEADLDPLSAETINTINSHPAIKSTGFQYDVRPYLTLSDALVFPSYREGFPNGVLQAGAMGLPCIVSDINGCNEIIKNGQNGRIIPAKDQQALLNAMRELLSDSELVAEMKQNARPMIVDRFSQRVVWDGILEEYRKFGNPDRHYVS